MIIIHCPHCAKANRLPIDRLSQMPICGACKKDLLSLPIIANRKNYQELTSQPGLPVIVDFWAPWCEPCKTFSSTFEASAMRYANKVLHLKINTETEQAISQQFQIRSIPTLIGF